MSEDNALVLVAGYQDLDSARHDFQTLVDAAKDKSIPLQGAVLIGKDAEGSPVLVDTGNRLGRRGAAWGAGVGLAIGLFSPALLASAALGAATGALAGTFAHHRIKTGLADKIGQALAAGRAVVIAVTEAQGRLEAGQALASSPMKSVAELSRSTLRSLGAALREAMGKFNPDRTRLPLPQRRFGGVVGRTMAESVGDWSIVPGPFPPDDAPNVLIVLIDDAGFGGPDTFGGAIRTPTLSRLAQNGLIYNRFHVTAVCSPTRAALLTGRNHHRVGFGSVCEFPGPYPGYSAVRPRSCAALPRILRDNGYVTGAFGKWHLTPDNVQGAAGPFDNWPLGWGFDHFWGFPSGAAGQYDPIISQDNSVIGIPEGSGEDGRPYYFPDDLTDKAIEWLHTVRAQNATKPWMLYYATGATHAPHHVFKEWADKYRGEFDDGWDVYRQKTFERQKRLGIIPPDAELTERPDLFPAWDSMSEAQKRLFARQMEVFAGFSENADWNVGRLLDAIEDLGESDNTLVFYIWGDNGASMEGTNTGSFNEMTFLNGLDLDAERQLELIEQYGGIAALGDEFTAPHFASAWAHASNTPLQWGKQMASHLGGTRDPLVVAWPGSGQTAVFVASSPTASTSRRPCWRPSVYRSRPMSTASSRNRWTEPVSCGPSTTLKPKTATPCSTSKTSAAVPSTKTAGGRALAWTRRPGICHRRRCDGSRRGPTTRTRTSGSCTTYQMTSPRRKTWQPSIPTRSPSSPSCGGRRPNETGCCRCWAGSR